MHTLDRLVPRPRLVETDHVDVAADPARVWELVRHGDLGRTPLIRALFTLRTLPARLSGERSELRLRIDDLASSAEHPGFQVLLEEPPSGGGAAEVAVGAIGKVWKLEIPFVHVADAASYLAFAEPGFARVAWAIGVAPRGEGQTRVSFEVRVDATDEASWTRFRRYYGLIGAGSRFIRHSLLAGLARDLGTPETSRESRPLPGDERLPDAAGALTHAVDIAAPPSAIWPWLAQMGGRRGGFYSIDLLDNGGRRSAREIHPGMQRLDVGEILPATPDGEDGFEVLAVDEPRALVLGGLFDVGAGRQRPFAAPRPERFWHVTWAFVLTPLDDATTRLHVRARAAFPPGGRRHAAFMRRVHHVMQGAQLRGLKRRAEGKLPVDDWRDVVDGIGGAAIMAAAFLTPFLRASRGRWGLPEASAARRLPGDALVPEPLWSYTHGVEIDAPPSVVWPYVAQVGATRGGFYSYQWLENLAGCRLRNAEVPHPEWQARAGDALYLHPEMPPFRIVEVEPERHLVAFAPVDETARAAGTAWSTATWLFLVEPLEHGRSRFVSRFRTVCSTDLATRLALGPAITEPISFAMDRRMVLRVKELAEHAVPA